MRRPRITQLWADRPWKRRKSEKDVEVIPRTPTPARDDSPPQQLDRSLTATIERNARRLSRIWKNEESKELPQRRDSVLNNTPTRTYSLRGLRPHRSFFKSEDEPTLVEEQTNTDEPLPQPLERDTILARLKRRSHSISRARPSTSSGVPRRLTFFGSRADEHDHAVPDLPAFADPTRPRSRHVPITIDHLQTPAEATGMAITTNEPQELTHVFTERPPARPMSSSSSFSQLRVRSPRTVFNQHQGVVEESESSFEDDTITALPSMDFKDFHIAELRVPGSGPRSPPRPERQSIRRVTPKIVDIVSPRPMTMIAAQATRKSLPAKDRHKSMVQPASTPIGALEDGPKGDWSRTRHSWVGIGGDGETEQLEWDKLKQFMEAYGSGRDGVISIRAVNGTDSDSSGSVRNSQTAKFSNAQALAALEFGL